MSSMEEMLNSLLDQGAEKTAAPAEVEAPAAAVNEEQDIITKVASALTEEEIVALEKFAGNHEAEKTAAEAEAYGRFMAKGFYDQLQKEASSMNSEGGTEGTPTIAHGGGGTQMSEGKTVDTQAANDPSVALKTVKSKLDAMQQPASPNAKQDGYEVVKKIIQTAREVKQQKAEMPNNG